MPTLPSRPLPSYPVSLPKPPASSPVPAASASVKGESMLGPILAAGISAAASLFGSRSASKAQKDAAWMQYQAQQQAMALERERLEQERKQWEAEQQRQADLEMRRRLETDREYQLRAYENEILRQREARREPYRQVSLAALATLGKILGLKVPTTVRLDVPVEALSSPASAQTLASAVGLPPTPRAASLAQTELYGPVTMPASASSSPSPAPVMATEALLNPRPLRRVLSWEPEPPARMWRV